MGLPVQLESVVDIDPEASSMMATFQLFATLFIVAVASALTVSVGTPKNLMKNVLMVFVW